VLGLTSLQDQEGSSAFLYGKDHQRERSTLLAGLNPTLYTDHELNKRAFYSSLEDKRRQIEDGERALDRLRKLSNQPLHKK
jgi:hypothetical protein